MADSKSQSFFDAIDLFGRSVDAANFVLDHWWIWPLAIIGLWMMVYLRNLHALLQKLDERADAAFGDVHALLMERHGLVGNLTEAVRGFTRHERGVIGDVLEGRVAALEAVSGAVSGIVDTQFAAALNNLFSVVENYPALAAAEHYRTLRQDLIRIEERITAGRKFYNLAVEESNAMRRSFPGNLLARHTPTREKFSVGERRGDLAEPVQIQL